MISYINNSLLLAFLVIGMAVSFTSCSDDNFIDENTITEIDNPDTLGYIYLTGLIKDGEGNTLSNVTLDYLVNGELTTVSTNESGIYEIRNLDGSSNRTAVRCHTEGFIPKIEVLVSNEDNAVEKDIILAKEGSLSGGSIGEASQLILTDTLINITGRLINEDGDGISGTPILILDFDFNSFVYGVTDQDGNWSISMEPKDEATVISFNQCESFEFIEEGVSLTDDTDLGDFITSQIQPVLLNFSGFVTDCNTQEGLLSGRIQFSFPDSPDKFDADISNGQYTIEVPQCTANDCIDVTIFSFESTSGVDDFMCQVFTADPNTLDFEVCNSPIPNTNEGYLSTILDGVTSEYQFVTVDAAGPKYLISTGDASTDVGVIFITENKEDIGTFDLAAIITLSGQDALYNAGSGAITYQIDSITTEYLYGSYQGNIIDLLSNLEVSLEGEFKAKFQ